MLGTYTVFESITHTFRRVLGARGVLAFAFAFAFAFASGDNQSPPSAILEAQPRAAATRCVPATHGLPVLACNASMETGIVAAGTIVVKRGLAGDYPAYRSVSALLRFVIYARLDTPCTVDVYIPVPL